MFSLANIQLQSLSSSPVVNSVVNYITTYWGRCIIYVIVFLAVYEQLFYLRKRQGLPGPLFVVPFLGSIVTMVRQPYHFWHSQFDLGKMSWNALVGSFMVVSSDADTTRFIFENTSDDMPLILHPNAYKLLGTNNMAFMNGEYHKELRRRLLPLFTTKALGIYLQIQQQAIHEHLKRWYQDFKSVPSSGYTMKQRIWDLNCQTSMSVFIGPYLDATLRDQIQTHYKCLTEGFLTLPLNYPGSALNKGIKAKKLLIPLLEGVVNRCKQAMASGKEPICLLDFWMVNTVKEIADVQAQGQEQPPHSTDYEVACITLDFLFASQDASTASLTWCIDTLCRYPDVLTRIRQEQEQARPNHETITLDRLKDLPYTTMVMKEILRMYPPATMVPHTNKYEVQLGEVTVPKNSIIVPSIYSACHQGFTNGNEFDPERFNETRNEGVKYAKNFLTFGTGPHSCMGQRYAMNHLLLFLSIIAQECDFTRQWNDSAKRNDYMYAPTIYPADECILLSFKQRA